MDEINNSRYIDTIYVAVKDILKNWFSIICISVCAVLLTYIGASIYYSPVYTSKCTMVVSAKENHTGAYANITQTTKLIDTITGVLDSSVLKKKTAETAGYSSFDATLDIVIVESTNLLEVSVTSDSSLKSFKLLTALIDIYPQLSKDVLGDVVIQIFEAPNFPSSPSNTFSYQQTLTYALLISAGVVILIVASYSYFYNNIKTEWDANEKLDSKLLGVVCHESIYRKTKDRLLRHKKRLLIGSPGVSFGFSETIKKIRTNALYFKEKNGGNVILITSYKKREGKSVVAANLATSLAQQGKSVLLISGGFSPESLIEVLGLDFSEYFVHGTKCDIYDFIYEKENSNLSILVNPSGDTFSSDPDKFNSIENFSQFVGKFAKEYDYVIIDGPCAKHSANAEYFAKHSDFSVLVVKQNGAKVSHLNDTIDMLNKYNSGLCGFVFNDVYSAMSIINIGYGSYNSYNRYGKYGKYSRYNKYSKYGAYNQYGAYYNYEENSSSPKHSKLKHHKKRYKR
ncbi:MAG: AAA family ATPase [Eubacteriales bacterium]|nr:AAA family ATPase [Eubacteriales bacterium]